MERGKVLYMVAVLAFILVGCGAIISTQTRIVFEPYAQDENKKTDSGITIERYQFSEMPPDLLATIQDGDPSTGLLKFDVFKEPKMVQVCVFPKGSMIEKIAITNNTGHIVRLNTTVITAFDPADNQYNPLSKPEIAAYLQQQRPLPNTPQLVNQLNLVALIDRNTELLPDRTFTGYIVYQPKNPSIPGVWKLTFYELPVETNAAGISTKTVRFEFRSVCKKYIDTYKQENSFAKPVKISTEEAK